MAPVTAPHAADRVIERQVQISVYPVSGRPQHLTLRAHWRADSDRRTHAELGELPGHGDGEAGPVLGRITVTWRNMSDGLSGVPILGSLLSNPATRSLRQVWNPDPAVDLGEITIEIDESVTGRPLRGSTRRAGSTTEYWKVSGGPADWWTSVVVQRDGVPIPAEFGEA